MVVFILYQEKRWNWLLNHFLWFLLKLAAISSVLSLQDWQQLSFQKNPSGSALILCRIRCKYGVGQPGEVLPPTAAIQPLPAFLSVGSFSTKEASLLWSPPRLSFIMSPFKMSRRFLLWLTVTETLHPKPYSEKLLSWCISHQIVRRGRIPFRARRCWSALDFKLHCYFFLPWRSLFFLMLKK